jgi:succinate dehydrogenase / fumarate reductase membrane anchor subunit
MQRLTALALIPLGLWLVITFLSNHFTTYEQTRMWMASSYNTFALAALVGILSYHTALGIQAILEDYISTRWLHGYAIIVVKIILSLLFGFALLALWEIKRIQE